jgi:hypothetical protein
MSASVKQRLCRTFTTLAWKNCSYVGEWLQNIANVSIQTQLLRIAIQFFFSYAISLQTYSLYVYLFE